MPKIAYASTNFSASSLEIIERANEVCETYAQAGYNLTLRQLYYQFVSRDWLPNTQQSYKRLGSIVNDARLAGLIDWNHLEDRTRNLNGNGHIHRSLNGCPTVNRNGKATSMGWATELSGLPVSTAIEMPPVGLGPRLCSVCFPDAPVEHCRTLSDITREQREAERQAKAEAKRLADEAKEQRRLAREAKAAEPRKETPQERRWAAMKDLGDKFHPVAGRTREEVASAIDELAGLGKAPKWQDAITAWAKAVRDEENDITWAFGQYSVYASYAA